MNIQRHRMTIENLIIDGQVHTLFLEKKVRTPLSVVKMFAFKYNETVKRNLLYVSWTVFLVDEQIQIPLISAISPPANNCLAALWFFRRSGSILLRNPMFLWFVRGRGPDPLFPLWIRTWLLFYSNDYRRISLPHLLPFVSVCFMGMWIWDTVITELGITFSNNDSWVMGIKSRKKYGKFNRV